MEEIAAAAVPLPGLFDRIGWLWRRLGHRERMPARTEQTRSHAAGTTAAHATGGNSPPRLFTIEYRIRAMPIAALRSCVRELSGDRRCVGASQWRAYADPGSPGCLIESFTLTQKEL